MKFALITEGPSEHRIIKHIIAKYFKDQEPEINQIQPKIVNEKQETIIKTSCGRNGQTRSRCCTKPRLSAGLHYGN